MIKARSPFGERDGTGTDLLVDTSTIIEIFRNPKNSEKIRLINEQIHDEELYLLVVQLAELSDWCIENNVSPRERVEAVKKISNIIPLDEEICLEGSKIKAERRKRGHRDFGLLDGLVLAAARSLDEKLVTFDKDFSGESDCLILE